LGLRQLVLAGPGLGHGPFIQRLDGGDGGGQGGWT